MTKRRRYYNDRYIEPIEHFNLCAPDDFDPYSPDFVKKYPECDANIVEIFNTKRNKDSTLIYTPFVNEDNTHIMAPAESYTIGETYDGYEHITTTTGEDYFDPKEMLIGNVNWQGIGSETFDLYKLEVQDSSGKYLLKIFPKEGKGLWDDVRKDYIYPKAGTCVYTSTAEGESYMKVTKAAFSLGVVVGEDYKIGLKVRSKKCTLLTSAAVNDYEISMGTPYEGRHTIEARYFSFDNTFLITQDTPLFNIIIEKNGTRDLTTGRYINIERKWIYKEFKFTPGSRKRWVISNTILATSAFRSIWIYTPSTQVIFGQYGTPKTYNTTNKYVTISDSFNKLGGYSGISIPGTLRGTLEIPKNVKQISLGDIHLRGGISKLIIKDSLDKIESIAGVVDTLCWDSHLKYPINLGRTVYTLKINRVRNIILGNIALHSGYSYDNNGFIYYTENGEKHCIWGSQDKVATDITIGDCKVIETASFASCDKITGVVTIPSSVEEIQASAFKDSGITGIVLNEGLKKIGKWAFYNTRNLGGDLIIPLSVINIDVQAFGGNFNNVVIPGALSSVAKNFLSGSYKNVTINTNLRFYIHPSVSVSLGPSVVDYYFYDNVLYYKPTKTLVWAPRNIKGPLHIEEGCEIIENASYSEYTEVIIPDSVKEVLSGCFTWSNIEHLNVPRNTKVSGGFAKVTSLYSVKLYWNSLEYISDAKDFWAGVNHRNCIIHIPKGTLPLYESKGWKVYDKETNTGYGKQIIDDL